MSRCVSTIVRGGLGFFSLAISLAASFAHAEDLFLTDGKSFPGQLLVSRDGEPERAFHVRKPKADPAYPKAVMKARSVAVDVEGNVYYCSGLDGSIMQLLDGKNEIQPIEFPGQIRDLACTGEPHTIYFSVVATPQNNEPLEDGKIYRRDFWEGQATEVATIRQEDVGYNWWGAFTIRDGVIHIATLEDHSHIFKLTGRGPTPVFQDNLFKVTGFTSREDGGFLFTTQDGAVYATRDFFEATPVLQSDRDLCDVAVRAWSSAPRP